METRKLPHGDGPADIDGWESNKDTGPLSHPLFSARENRRWNRRQRKRIYCVLFYLSSFTHWSHVSTDDKQYWKYSFVILDWPSKDEPAGKNRTLTKIHLHLLEQVSLKKCSQQIKSADIIQKIQQTLWQRLLNFLELPLSSWNFNESFLPFFVLPQWIIKIKYFNISKCSVSKYIHAHEPPRANEYTKPRREVWIFTLIFKTNTNRTRWRILRWGGAAAQYWKK